MVTYVTDSLTYHTDYVIAQDLILKQNYKNVNQLPRLKKVVINTGSQAVLEDKKSLIFNLLAAEFLSGQKAKQIQSKLAVASFYLQKGHWIGWKTTLRHIEMYSFLTTLINKVLPATDYFSGFTEKNLDTGGNLQLGLDNLLLFPELDWHFESFESVQGMNITLTSTAQNRMEAKLLFSALRFPFDS